MGESIEYTCFTYFSLYLKVDSSVAENSVSYIVPLTDESSNTPVEGKLCERGNATDSIKTPFVLL
jgi:hypothetical protein